MAFEDDEFAGTSHHEYDVFPFVSQKFPTFNGEKGGALGMRGTHDKGVRAKEVNNQACQRERILHPMENGGKFTNTCSGSTPRHP